jgi:hypothetical protein
VRASRDLVHTATQLGPLSADSPAKVFSAIPSSNDILLFYAQMIADLEGSSAKVPSSDLWRTMMIPASEVHVTLLHLHQFRRLDYQVAARLVQLMRLPRPCPSGTGRLSMSGAPESFMGAPRLSLECRRRHPQPLALRHRHRREHRLGRR